MVDKLKRASLPLAFSRVYDRFGPTLLGQIIQTHAELIGQGA
jgi:hypothetical protein